MSKRKLTGKAAILAAGICVAAALPSWAATNITENVTLTEDADWREHGHVTIVSGVTVALNGYKLKVKGLTCNGSIVGIEGYRQLTYIQASREQWIDTGFVPTATTALDVDFTTTDCNDNRAYFGAGWAKDYMLLVNTGYFRFWADGGNLLAFTANKHYRFATLPDETPNVVMYDGETGDLLGSATKSLVNNKGYTMLIFACHQDNGTSGFQPSRYRLHSFKMTDNGMVVRDLVPVVRTSDGAAGLWDRAHSQFYGNVGNGTFIQGPDLTTLILDLSDSATYSFNGTCTVPFAVGDSTLAQDCDLRALGNVEIAGEVALNGHKLYTAGVTGGGTILNQSGMYSHYRFKVEAIGSGQILAISDLRLYSYDDNVTAQRSGASSSYGGGRTSASETYDKALDNSVNNKWCVQSISNFNTLWVQVDYAEPIMISKYEWYSTNDGAQQDRAPTKWRFQGSNDGTNWTDIDVVERAYGDNPSTSKTLAYTYNNGLTQAPVCGEFHVEVPQGMTNENAVALDGNIKFFKDGAGTLTETRSTQSHKGGDEITAGVMAYSAANYVLPGDLMLAGGTLAITDGNPLTVSGAMSVTSPSTVKFISDNPFGRKLLITGAGTGFAVGDLTLVTEPAITGTGTLSVDDGNLYASFGAADDVVLARWTGAVDGDVSKSGNWNCYNALGTLLSDKLPSALTDVRIEGDVNIQMPVGATIAYDQFTIGDCTLTTNCDWRGLCGPISGTVKPDGHRLILTDFLGTGTIQGNPGGYAHYRFKVEAIGSGTTLAFSDLRLYSYDVNVTTERSGASGSTGGGGAPSGQTYLAALDNSVDNKWCATYIKDFDTLWVQVDYAKPILITKYEWYSTNDGLQRDRAPTKWRFQGSDDGANWVDIDVVERAYEDNPETSKTLAYTGYVTPATSVLQVDVADGVTKTNSTLALSGYLKVEKTGAGTFVANKAGQASFGGTEVMEGTLMPGVNSAGVFGKGGDTLAVTDGAQILDNLAAHDAFARHYLQLAGEGPDGTGAYRVTAYRGSAYSLAWTRGLTVTNDTLFGRDDYGFGLVAPNAVALPLALNGKTLTFKSSNGTGQNETHLPFRNVQGDGPGTLVISDYVRLYPKNEASTLSEVTLVIDTLGRYHAAQDEANISVSNLVFRSTVQSASTWSKHAITVFGGYKPESTVYLPKVQMGDATHLSPTLDLSEWTGTFNAGFGGGLTFTEGTTVSVKVGDRKVPRKVIGWTAGTGPANVNFVLVDAQGRLTVESDGVYRLTGLVIIVK